MFYSFSITNCKSNTIFADFERYNHICVKKGQEIVFEEF